MRRKRVLLLVLLLAVLTFSLTAYQWLFAGLPPARIDPARLHTASIRILDRNGRLLYESLPSEGGRHTSIPLRQIPVTLQQATIATEDVNFYQNPGIELTGIVRAAWINLTGGETLSGGSTITQQVARNLILSDAERSERTLRRKLREAILAYQLSQKYPKDEILSLYLNQSYYGGFAYGVEAASQTYFGKPASELDLAESALLAGLPQAPSAYDPFTDPQAALERRSTVLGLMEKAHFISSDVRLLAEREPLNLARTPYPMEAPHFDLMVLAQVDTLFSQDQILSAGGITVHTTLDLNAQHASENAITHQLERLKEKGQSGLGYNVNNAALVALDPHTGEILAMVGSPDINDQASHGAINMALAPRQPGSALKPIIYAAAFDPSRQHPWTAATMILDVSTNFITHDGKPYTPKNYDGQEHGPVLARQALSSSLNIPAVLTLKDVGLPAFFALAGRFGLDSFGNPDNYDLSLALGGGEVRLVDLTSAYGVFANGGYRVEPFSILEITDANGAPLYTHTPGSPTRVIDERTAWLVTDILSDDTARLLGFQAHSTLNIDRPAAVKTGTTTNFHDNWTIGYTPDLVVGVWVGNASHEAMREVNGLTGAAPIWHQAIRDILSGTPVHTFQRPPGLQQVEVCSLSGLLVTPDCPYTRIEWFIDGTAPTVHDNLYQSVWIDSLTGKASLSPSDCPPGRCKVSVAINLPPSAFTWAREHNLLLLADLQHEIASTENLPANPNQAASQLEIISPAPLTTYKINSETPLATQSIPLEVNGASSLTQVAFYIDGTPIAVLVHPPYRYFWQLFPGSHILWAVGKTEDGRSITSQQVEFKVESAGP